MARTRDDELLLGEWACLGVLYRGQAHGFAVAAELKPEGDVGRVWSMSRALTYRALDQLQVRELVRAVGSEPGIAGGPRTILSATRSGRARLRSWLTTPVTHLRDVRSELLLKLVLAERNGIDVTAMLRAQRTTVAELAAAIDERVVEGDPVGLWRSESAHATLRFLDRALAAGAGQAAGR